MKEIKLCERCKLYGRGKNPNPATEPHTCPFAEEVAGDHESLCTCCDKCTRECAMDV